MSTSRNPCDRGEHRPQALAGAAQGWLWCSECGGVKPEGGRWRRPGRKAARARAVKSRQLDLSAVWERDAPLRAELEPGDNEASNTGQENGFADELRSSATTGKHTQESTTPRRKC